MPKVELQVTFEDGTRAQALGFTVPPEMPEWELKGLMRALGQSACDTVGIKYQAQEQYKVYRGLRA